MSNLPGEPCGPAGPAGPAGPGGPAKKVSRRKQGRIHQIRHAKTLEVNMT